MPPDPIRPVSSGATQSTGSADPIDDPATPLAGAPGADAAAAEGTTPPVDGADGTNPPAGTDGDGAPVAEGGESPEAGATAEGADAAPDGDFYQSLGNQADAPDNPVSPTDSNYSTGTPDSTRDQLMADMDALVQSAANGDVEAQRQLDLFTQNQRTLAQLAGNKLAEADQFTQPEAQAQQDKKGKGDGEKLLAEAQQQSDTLKAMEKRLAKAQEGLKPNNPLHADFRKSLQTQTAAVAKQRAVLDQQITSYEAKLNATKMASAQQQLDALTKGGKPLTDAQIATLKKQFGEDLQFVMKNGRMVVLKGEGQGPAVAPSPKGKQGGAAGNRNGEKAPPKPGEARSGEAPAGDKVAVADNPKDPDAPDKPKDPTKEFMNPTPADVRKAEVAVLASGVSPNVVEQRRALKIESERKAALANGLARAGGKVKAGTGEGASTAGAEELAAEIGRKNGLYRKIKQQQFDDTILGTNNLAGLVICDRSLVGIDESSPSPSTGEGRGEGGTAVAAISTPAEARDQLAGLERPRKGFKGDFEDGIWGFLPKPGWDPPGVRIGKGCVFGGDLRRENMRFEAVR